MKKCVVTCHTRDLPVVTRAQITHLRNRGFLREVDGWICGTVLPSSTAKLKLRSYTLDCGLISLAAQLDSAWSWRVVIVPVSVSELLV